MPPPSDQRSLLVKNRWIARRNASAAHPAAVLFASVVVVTGAACAPLSPPPVAVDPVVQPSVETRAVWITRFDYADAASLEQLIDRIAEAGFNTLYFQARVNADALYEPALEPWAPRFTGRVGADPGWDPLGTAIRRGARHDLQVHAWLNAFPGWSGSPPTEPTRPEHARTAHPDWFMADTLGRPLPNPATQWLSPAHPAVRSRLAAVAADVARRYPVAGIHLDFIRYPAPDPADSLALRGHAAARAQEPTLTLDEYRRRAVTSAVRETRDSLRSARPGAQLSTAVWGIYRAPQGWTGVSTGYEDRLQDARAWAAQGLVDAVVPMVYWPMRETYGERLDFAYLVDDHVRGLTGSRVFIGITLETVREPQALQRHIERARQAGADGVVLLSARLLAEHDLWAELARGPFRSPARPVDTANR
jgi:uncharacterized lipoprotein YddW (UPF0748 family)